MKRHPSKDHRGRTTAGILVLVALFLAAGCAKDDNPAALTSNTVPAVLEPLKAFQPLLVQQHAESYAELPYPETSDLIGRLSMLPDPEGFDYAVQADTGSPVMYAFETTMTLRGRDYPQLIYAFFYPERPMPLGPEDNFFEWTSRFLYSGLIDGKVIRITLDAEKRFPLFVEVVRNCGCSWQFYANKAVDDAARQEFEDQGTPYPGLGKPDAPHDVQYVWVLPEDLPSARDHVVVVAEEGWGASPHHTLAACTSYEQWLANGPAVGTGVLYVPDDAEGLSLPAGTLEVRPLSRLNYETLRTLPAGGSDQPVGIFDGFGYVWNAYSPLTKLMRALGAKEFPGTPRDPMHLEVVHETMDFWAPSLYERFIYLPESIFGPPEG